jgi:mitochondrial fission protein ELM1
MTAESDALGFREECSLLQLKCDLLVGGQDHAYSFQNARNREDAVQSLQRFVHCEVSFEATFHRNLRASSESSHRSKTISVFSRL